MIINFPKCLFIYILDSLGNTILFIIWVLFAIIGWDSWWLSQKEKNLDPYIGWPNDILNDCYRCKNEDPPIESNDTWDPFKTIKDGLNSLTRNSFFIFMVIIALILCAYFIIYYYLLKKYQPLQTSIQTSVQTSL